jgi:hypothetical protein
MILHIPYLTVIAQTLFALLLGIYIGKVVL